MRIKDISRAVVDVKSVGKLYNNLLTNALGISLGPAVYKNVLVSDSFVSVPIAYSSSKSHRRFVIKHATKRSSYTKDIVSFLIYLDNFLPSHRRINLSFCDDYDSLNNVHFDKPSEFIVSGFLDWSEFHIDKAEKGVCSFYSYFNTKNFHSSVFSSTKVETRERIHDLDKTQLLTITSDLACSVAKLTYQVAIFKGVEIFVPTLRVPFVSTSRYKEKAMLEVIKFSEEVKPALDISIEDLQVIYFSIIKRYIFLCCAAIFNNKYSKYSVSLVEVDSTLNIVKEFLLGIVGNSDIHVEKSDWVVICDGSLYVMAGYNKSTKVRDQIALQIIKVINSNPTNLLAYSKTCEDYDIFNNAKYVVLKEYFRHLNSVNDSKLTTLLLRSINFMQ